MPKRKLQINWIFDASLHEIIAAKSEKINKGVTVLREAGTWRQKVLTEYNWYWKETKHDGQVLMYIETISCVTFLFAVKGW